MSVDRRDFLKMALGLLGAPLLPSIPPPAPTGGFVSIDVIRRAVAQLEANNAVGPWTVLVHPSLEADLKVMLAKERWKLAYREARLQIRGLSRVIANGEIGTLENVRFISSPYH